MINRGKEKKKKNRFAHEERFGQKKSDTKKKLLPEINKCGKK